MPECLTFPVPVVFSPTVEERCLTTDGLDDNMHHSREPARHESASWRIRPGQALFLLSHCVVFLWFGFALATDGPSDEWVYEQSTGRILLAGERIGIGYSGHGEGLDNPDEESKADIGPIPRGSWMIGEPFKHETKGPIVMRLTPVGHKAYGREGFLIHGDNAKMNKSASNGCIVLSADLRMSIATSKVKRLVVIK